MGFLIQHRKLQVNKLKWKNALVAWHKLTQFFLQIVLSTTYNNYLELCNDIFQSRALTLVLKTNIYSREILSCLIFSISSLAFWTFSINQITHISKRQSYSDSCMYLVFYYTMSIFVQIWHASLYMQQLYYSSNGFRVTPIHLKKRRSIFSHHWI